MASRTPKINVRREPSLRKGPVRHSKRVDDRIKAAGSLRGSVARLKHAAADGFGERFAGELRDGEVMPDQTLALELAVRSVMSALEELVDADDLYCRKMIDRHYLDKDAGNARSARSTRRCGTCDTTWSRCSAGKRVASSTA